jgi:hypothetical protein
MTHPQIYTSERVENLRVWWFAVDNGGEILDSSDEL